MYWLLVFQFSTETNLDKKKRKKSASYEEWRALCRKTVILLWIKAFEVVIGR